ncbi:hypothetical protein C2W64_01184 [Brevibacillus laterosporus]|uniref:Uncharacterized protein n=1 Tax=Brevibacillus laterosporus TaxID=1465 RepID=A0A518V841_BRELA|nr:hypothetical protein [Brevibacillus laterosporus]QDX93177.1 hypothetical protein EEL30_13190 [Brevibacillus laterosporus]RAP27038.1 hypothetical protein C2W64_01184 [Brevibacillus laterosporus]
MKKLLVSLSTFAVLTGVLTVPVPTFAATEINTVKETNSQVQLIKPAFDVIKGGMVSLYSPGVGWYEVDGRGLWVAKQGGQWYLFASSDASNGTVTAYDTNGKFIQTYQVNVH